MLSTTEAANQLVDARRACDEAQAAVNAAQDAFDLSGDDSELKRLCRAREKLTAASEHAARAERLLAAAKQSDAGEQERAKQAELAILERELSRENMAEIFGPLHEQLYAHLLGITETLQAIYDRYRELRVKETRASALRGSNVSLSVSVPINNIEEKLGELSRAAGDTYNDMIIRAVRRAFVHELQRFAREP